MQGGELLCQANSSQDMLNWIKAIVVRSIYIFLYVFDMTQDRAHEDNTAEAGSHELIKRMVHSSRKLQLYFLIFYCVGDKSKEERS